MPMRFSTDDLLNGLDWATIAAGSQLRQQDRVRVVEGSADGTRISGTVSGSRFRPYSQTIMLSNDRGRVRIKGYCSCSLGINCKHVTAVLLEHLAQFSGADPVLARPEAKSGSTGKQLQCAPQSVSSKPRSGLSDQVAGWLDRLRLAMTPPDSTQAPARANQRVLLYVLNHADAIARSATSVCIRVLSVRLRKDGSITDEKSYELENVIRPREQRARFISEADVSLLRDLMWLKRSNGSAGPCDIGLGAESFSVRILHAALATGRLRLGAASGPVLSPGPAVSAELHWMKTERGGQKLSFLPIAKLPEPAADTTAVPRFDWVLPLDPLHYVDIAAGQVGAIELRLPAQLAIEIARAPVIAASEARFVNEFIQQQVKAKPAQPREPTASNAERPVSLLLPAPDVAERIETRTIVPVARLELLLAQVRLKPNYYWYAGELSRGEEFPLPLARLSFDYDGEIIPSDWPGQTVERVEADRLILIPRDEAAELLATKRLSDIGLKALDSLPFVVQPEHARDFFIAPPSSGTCDFMTSFADPARFTTFSAEVVPQLIKEGWHVVFSQDYPYRIAGGDSQWWADIGESSGIDWFSFELGLEFDGERINLVPLLTKLINDLPAKLVEQIFLTGADQELNRLCEKLKLYHELADGRLLPVPGERLAPMLKALLELIGPRRDRLIEGTVRLHRADASALAIFAGQAGTDLAWAASAGRLVELGNRLRHSRSLDRCNLPASFRGRLRSYQCEGVAWLDFLRDAGFGGVLADDMGLGKTIQALALVAREKEAGRLDQPALVVCPTSVLPNWMSEAERFAPQLVLLPLRGLNRRELFENIPKSDIVLTTYPLLARDHQVLLNQAFHLAILDEAQAIKNPRALISGFAYRINARHRLALTGTPLENNLGEVWSLFEFLTPGLLGDEASFRRRFRMPIEKHGDATAQVFLSRRLKPFMLRRTKEDVAKELPAKTEILERVRLEGAQRDLYETVRALMHRKVRHEIATKGFAKSRIVFLDALLKLRQTCCDPRLLQMPQARRIKNSAKLERLMEMIPELLGEGRRILVFSQFTKMLALIEDELVKLKIPYVILTGKTVDRAKPVAAFQAGQVPLFLLSLKAGGTGLNLTAADTVIHYDPWWNPAVETQATDRAHRIGQDKPIFVYKLMVEEGVEVAIEQLKARKAALAQALFAGLGKTPLDLTDADISALFAPLESSPERCAA